MKRSVAVLAAFVSLSLLGCGGAPVEAEPVGELSQELSTCTATCSGGTVTCSGDTCSAADYQGVTCDGVFKSCACAGLPACSGLVNKRCTYPEGTALACCLNGDLGYLYCISGDVGRVWVYE